MLILMLAVPFIGVFGISAVVIVYGLLSDWRGWDGREQDATAAVQAAGGDQQ